MRRFRQVNEARDAQFPEFRRYDVQYWSRWKFYPGATLMPVRVSFFIANLCVLATGIKILTFGHNFKKGPIPDGFRKECIKFMYRLCVNIGLLIAGHTSET